MSRGRNLASSRHLQEASKKLERDPQNQGDPCRKPNPFKNEADAKEEAQPNPGKLQRIKNKHAGDPAARADAGYR